ncbi:DUF3311 domain-containing protein [Brevibacillus sp. SYP-B805]|uniref:DUF3311 domain-containing protein n=1 Tax=Brevibacillus sp. SYP-B805 TaxID=1578199 RepID=UPI0013EE0C8A|nr:DUF3311 domain-containing protein [Brevibacillus sp. SYP-B805]
MKLIHLLALLPFIGILGCISWINKVTPYVFGLPFLLFWIVFWVIATSVIMTILYRLDPANKKGESQ